MTIGLTGGIGSGKSTVAKVLESMGYPVFYSDQVAKELMASDRGLQTEITSHFGENAFENGKPSTNIAKTIKIDIHVNYD